MALNCIKLNVKPFKDPRMQNYCCLDFRMISGCRTRLRSCYRLYSFDIYLSTFSPVWIWRWTEPQRRAQWPDWSRFLLRKRCRPASTLSLATSATNQIQPTDIRERANHKKPAICSGSVINYVQNSIYFCNIMQFRLAYYVLSVQYTVFWILFENKAIKEFLQGLLFNKSESTTGNQHTFSLPGRTCPIGWALF